MTTSEQEQEIALLKAENSRLAEMCQWITQARNRSESAEVRLNDYREALPESVDLLMNKGFRTAYLDLMDQYQREFMNSQPDQPEVREASYVKCMTLQQLLLKIEYQSKLVKEADRAKEKALLAAGRNNSQKL